MTTPPAHRIDPGAPDCGWWRAVARCVGDLVVDSSCAGCGRRSSPAWCAGCAATLAGPAHLAMPTPSPPLLPPVWAVTDYDAAVRRAIVAHKEDGRVALAAPLGAALARAVRAAATGLDGCGRPILLVPVPSTAAATRARGADPLRRLSRRAVRELRSARWDETGGDDGFGGLMVTLACALRTASRQRSVRDQAGLDALARFRNLRGAHVLDRGWASRLQGASVVLLDDVVTTGATLAEAARVLRAAGAGDVRAAVVAATRRTWQPRQPRHPPKWFPDP